MTELPPVDWSRIQAVAEGDIDFERELLNLFVQDCTRRLHHLEMFVQGNDAETIRLEAHTIKGSANNVGATDVAEKALLLENNALTGDFKQNPFLLADLKKVFAVACEAVENRLNSSI
jgi:HPt (histidine-containing phosphotransfer) domain-containing protein